MTRLHRTVALAAALICLGAATAPAAIVVLEPVADNTLYEDPAGALSNGAGSFIIAGVTDAVGGNEIRRALLRFDIAGSLPAGATITTASLALSATREPIGASGATFTLHPVAQNWGEGTSDAPTQEGQGTTATTGDATWLHTFHDTATWTTAGGDFGAASATQSIDNPGTYDFSSAAMALEVQAWLDTPAGNFGWILRGDEAGTANARQFGSRTNGTAGNRPQLTIDYVEPPVTVVDPFVRYKVKAAKIDGNSFPKRDFNLTLDDTLVDDIEPDDPENYQVRKEKSLLLAAAVNDAGGPSDPDLNYLRYQISEAKEGIGAGTPGDFPKAAKALPRRWNLTNQFGTLSVDSAKVTALLLPAAVDTAAPPTALSGDRTHYICYKVKPAKDVVSDQTPGGSFRKDLQAFLADAFADCTTAYDGSPAFAGTPVAGSCLYDVTKPVELCSPAAKSAVDGGRVTVAAISDSTPNTGDALLCYKPKLAGKITSTSAAALLGGAIGDAVAKQSKHAKRLLDTGTQVYTAPANAFPAPGQIDTSKAEAVCFPTEVVSIDPL
jgi:hypothetical protein